MTNTLDEPIADTVLRDLRQVGSKLRVVLLPRENQEGVLRQLMDWDLWGPLLVCLALSIMLSLTAPADQAALVFAAVFVVVWCGAAIVTLNAQLLGGKISFFQSVCVLGYCVFPLALAAAASITMRALIGGGALFVVRLILVILGFVWSTRGEMLALAPTLCALVG